MEAPRRAARQRKPAADVLMSLPAHLLDDILLRLDICDAVRTSALSRAWRRRWEALPELPLSFRDRPFDTPPEVVDSILVRYSGRVSHFTFSVDERSAGRIDNWFIALSRRRVKSISLRGDFALHSSVFSCSDLVSLYLRGCRVPPLPVGFAGFPVLTKLLLVFVQFARTGENELAKIIAGSPLLQNLTLCDVEFAYGPSDAVLHAPNLLYLRIISPSWGWQIEELPHLNTAFICVNSYVGGRDLGEFLGSFAQVKNLTLHTLSCPMLTEGNFLETVPSTFDKLKSLELSTNFRETRTILAVLCLLRNAPNVENFAMKVSSGEQETEANTAFQNAHWTDGMCANLQVVRMEGVSCLSNEMSFIELVLSKATALRTMSISLGPLRYRSKSNEDALCELMTYRRASPHAQVFFDGKKE